MDHHLLTGTDYLRHPCAGLRYPLGVFLPVFVNTVPHKATVVIISSTNCAIPGCLASTHRHKGLLSSDRPNNQNWEKAFARPANCCDVIVASTRDDTSGGPPSHARQTIETVRVALKCIPLLITHSFPVVHSIRKVFQKTLYIKPLHL